MVKTESPEKSEDKEIEGGLKGLFNLRVAKKRVFDDELTFIKVKKGEQTVFRDKDGYHELSRNTEGRHSLRDLKSKD